MEIIDYYDKFGNYLGKCSKDEAHKLGLYHKVFSCLFINSLKNKVYMQYKNANHNEVNKQNKIDISASGHLIAGETIIDGVREIKEEANFEVNYQDLIFLGIRYIDVIISKYYIIREFCYMHLLDKEFNLEYLESIDDEVLYFIEFDIDNLINFLTNNEESIIGNTIYGEYLYTKDDFIKSYIEEDHFYMQYLNYAKKLKK